MAGLFDRIERSAKIIRAATKVLNEDGELLFLPLLSGVVTLIVGGLLILQAFDYGTFEALRDGGKPAARDGFYLWLFVFYVVEYFIVFFFNTALVGAALARLGGNDPTVGSALALALRRSGSILGYAVISATVGILLRALAERVGFFGRLVIGVVGVAWTVATFLVVPVMAAENVGPVTAILRSTELLKKSWGENLVGNAGISFVFSAIAAVLIAIGYGGGQLLLANGYELAASLVAVTAGLLLAGTMIFASALSGVFQAALNYFAVTGEPPRGFDSDLIRGAFAPKDA